MTEVLYPEIGLDDPILSPEELEALAGLSHLETALAKLTIKNAVLSIGVNPEIVSDVWTSQSQLTTARGFELTPDGEKPGLTEINGSTGKAEAPPLLPSTPARPQVKKPRKAKPVATRPPSEQKRRGFNTIPPGPDTEFERYIFPSYKTREAAILEIVKKYKGHPRVNELLRSVATPVEKQTSLSGNTDELTFLLGLASRYRLLERDEVHELYNRIERGLTMHIAYKAKPELPEEAEEACIDLAACYELVNCCNLRLPIKMCLIKFGRDDPMIVDFIQDGIVGLGKASRCYDYAKGYAFSTYATWWIKQSIERAEYNKRRAIRLPVHVAQKLNAFKGALRGLTAMLGREPTYYEILELTDVTDLGTDEKALLLPYLSPHLDSLDRSFNDADDSATHGDLIAGDSHVVEAYELEIKHVIEGVFKHPWLSDDEKVALSLRWGVYSAGLDEVILASGITYPDAFKIIDEARETSQAQRRTGEASNSDICRLMNTSVETVKELLEAAHSKLRTAKIGEGLEI